MPALDLFNEIARTIKLNSNYCLPVALLLLLMRTLGNFRVHRKHVGVF